MKINGINCLLVKARSVAEGDTVCFGNSRFNILVEQVVVSSDGKSVTFRHGDGTAASGFASDEYVYVAHPRPAIVG